MNENLTLEDINWLIDNNKIVLQFNSSEKRFVVGLPFAVEYADGNWWLCCQQGKFQLITDAKALFSRGVDGQHWVSILDFYRGFQKFREDKITDQPMPISIAPRDAEWLLGFVRQCLVVGVEVSTVTVGPVENRAEIENKSSCPRARIKTRRRNFSRRQFPYQR